MIDNIITLLEIARDEEIRGEYIDVALGKYKLPMTLKEGFTQYKRFK